MYIYHFVSISPWKNHTPSSFVWTNLNYHHRFFGKFDWNCWPSGSAKEYFKNFELSWNLSNGSWGVGENLKYLRGQKLGLALAQINEKTVVFFIHTG